MSQEHRYSFHTYGFARRSATVGSPVLLHASSFRMDSNTDPVYSNTRNEIIYHYKHLNGHLKDLILDDTPKISDQLPSALIMDNVQNERHKSKVSSSSQWELSYKQANWLERGKTRETKARLGWVSNLIGWEFGASFLDQSRSEVKQNRSCNRSFSIFFWKSLLVLHRTVGLI